MTTKTTGQLPKAIIDTAKVMAFLPENHVSVWFRDAGVIEFTFEHGCLYSDKGWLLEASKWQSLIQKIEAARKAL